MKLKNTEFGDVWGASGVQGFFGDGYWFHRFGRPFGLNFAGMTFVAKTTTAYERLGNMPLHNNRTFTPKELKPKCIVVNFADGVALNSVGLSGPGAWSLFNRYLWQQRTDPFFISFMSVEKTAAERLAELKYFVDTLELCLPDFNAPVGLQINYTCPNVGLHTALEELAGEVGEGLEVASKLKIPLVPKLNVLIPPQIACTIATHPACDAICVSNTIPWGQLPEEIDWEYLFGSKVSPLAHLGGGGLSGKPLLPLLIKWILEARKMGLQKPINAGGGILSKQDARAVFYAGADSISLGSVAFLRPWRVRGIISYVRGDRYYQLQPKFKAKNL